MIRSKQIAFATIDFHLQTPTSTILLMTRLQSTRLFLTAVSQLALMQFSIALLGAEPPANIVLDKQKQLEAQTFWDNRDWDWYKQQIPFFECPDSDITTTYYYRWELLTKHLTYGSTNSGYSFTEFIDRPFWSGAYGAISCPAGHQLYEARWLRQPRIARDYLKYWFRTPGAQPRNYSTWLADSAWAVNQIHRDDTSTIDLLPDLLRNYEGWEQRHFVPEVGLFWQTGHDDGMEFNINSRQTKDILRGAPSYRPSFNAYMWADAVAIAKLARLTGKPEIAERFEQKAASLKSKMLELLWDEKRNFFFPVFKNDEEREGHKIKALTKTYEDGQFAGDSHGRELIGYVPWQFNMLDRDKKYEVAWSKLMDRDGFYCDFGPSTVERNDPMFLLKNSCCWWSGQSWPYATTQTLKSLANVLQSYDREEKSSGDARGANLTRADYLKLLQIYARSHRKDGKPYLAEALHPDTGSFEGHDAYNHSEHYFHSAFCDLVITGLVGLTPRDDDSLELTPLAPPDWDYFALDDVTYRGHRVSILWDRTGSRYQHGEGFHVLVDGQKVATSAKLERIVVEYGAPLDLKPSAAVALVPTNFAVNNDGNYFPRLTASYTSPKTSTSKLNDGNYWYVQHPPNRWTCEGSPNNQDWVILDFGTQRTIHTIKLYPLDDSGQPDPTVVAPRKIEIEAWIDDAWRPIRSQNGVLGESPTIAIDNPQGHRANSLRIDPIEVSKLRFTLHHQPEFKSGLTEIEAWGDARLPLEATPPPKGNLAYNPKPEGFPKASASFTDRFGGKPSSAIDGKTVFLPTPMNRWTSYESNSDSDWLEIDFGREVEFRRIELAIYDDRGGVQPPNSYLVQHWNGNEWQEVANAKKSPEQPLGSQWNEARFDPIKSTKARVVFTHRGKARSGVSEILIWND
jgi:F5/8 type C domain